MVYGLIALYVLAGFIVLYKAFKNEDLFTDKGIRFVLGELTGLIALYFIWPFMVAYVFLSLPMSGRSDKEIMAQIEEMKSEFLSSNPFGEEIEFVDNTDCPPIDSRDTVTPNLLYLSETIRKLAYCDGAYFGEGWSEAKGCLIELEVCKKYNILEFVMLRNGKIYHEEIN